MTRVVVIEDEANIVESLRFILSTAGFDVEVALDGESGIALLSETIPAVVILDVMLPRRNGFEVLKWIRANPATVTVPVLMLTAKGQEQDRRTAESLGADAFISKPFANKAVVDRVERLLSNAQGS